MEVMERRLCVCDVIYEMLWEPVCTNSSIHLPEPVSTDLTIKPDSVLTNPIGKDGVRSWSM